LRRSDQLQLKLAAALHCVHEPLRYTVFMRSRRKGAGLMALCLAMCIPYACAYDWDEFDPRLAPPTGSTQTATGGAGGEGGANVSTTTSSSGSGGSGGFGGNGGFGGTPAPVTVTLGERSGADITGVTADTYTDLPAPTFNYGARGYAWSDGDIEATVFLLRFDVSALPTGATVQQVQLRLVTHSVSTASSINALGLYPMLEAWEEGTQNAAAGVANYNDRAANTPWTAPGAGPGSHDAMQLAGTVMPPIAVDTEYVVVLSASLVQGWVDAPANNHGLALLIDIAESDGSAWVTSEGVEGKQPLLEITYQPSN
jgi:hypothetical protein